MTHPFCMFTHSARDCIFSIRYLPAWYSSLGASWGLSRKEPPAVQEPRETWVLSLGGEDPGGGHGYPLHCSYLAAPMARGAWWTTFGGVSQSRTWLKRPCTHILTPLQNLPRVLSQFSLYSKWFLLGHRCFTVLLVSTTVQRSAPATHAHTPPLLWASSPLSPPSGPEESFLSQFSSISVIRGLIHSVIHSVWMPIPISLILSYAVNVSARSVKWLAVHLLLKRDGCLSVMGTSIYLVVTSCRKWMCDPRVKLKNSWRSFRNHCLA